MTTPFTPNDVAAWVGGRVNGDGGLALTGLAEIADAQPGELTFVGSGAYADRWPTSSASAAVVGADLDLTPGDGRALIVVDHADLAMATVLGKLAPAPIGPPAGRHPTAVIADDAVVADDAAVGPFCVIGPRAHIGAGAVLHAHVAVLDDAVIGDGSVLWPSVVVRERCVVGRRCVLEPQVVLGADGFGYRADHSGPAPRIVKVPHLGHVTLGDEVELGATTTVDRGKFGATSIGDGSKIDNHCQIGHNCRIGRMVMMSGCTAVAGSVDIGDGALIGGGARFKDHLTIGPGAQIAGTAVVNDNVPAGAKWAGIPAKDARTAFKEFAAVRQLPALLKKFRPLLNDLDD